MMAAKGRYDKSAKIKVKTDEHGGKPDGAGQDPAAAKAVKTETTPGATKHADSKPTGTGAAPKDDAMAGTDHVPGSGAQMRHAAERADMHHRHIMEHESMHGRHEREHAEAMLHHSKEG